MGKTYERIDGRLRTFIEAQPLFFTATAPLSGDGTVNLSPKGLKGSFAVIDELTSEHGVVTSELVPALSVARDGAARPGLRLARFRF